MQALMKSLGMLACSLGFAWLAFHTKDLDPKVWWCSALSCAGFFLLFLEPWKGKSLGKCFNWLKWPHPPEQQ